MRVDLEAMRADALAVVEDATPSGWTNTLLRNPWGEERCPCCSVQITVERMAVAVLTKRFYRLRTILFTMTIVCDSCVADRNRLDGLSAMTFE